MAKLTPEETVLAMNEAVKSLGLDIGLKSGFEVKELPGKEACVVWKVRIADEIMIAVREAGAGEGLLKARTLACLHRIKELAERKIAKLEDSP